MKLWCHTFSTHCILLRNADFTQTGCITTALAVKTYQATFQMYVLTVCLSTCVHTRSCKNCTVGYSCKIYELVVVKYHDLLTPGK